MRPFVRLGAPVAPAALLLAAVAGWLTTLTAQQQDSGRGIKQILSDIAAPGIDRGLRDADPPRPAPTSSARRLLTPSDRYLRGSLIVRFKPGTLPAAQRALLAQVDATAGPAVSYADFDIVTLAGNDDPEAVARRLSAQPDVEYAQARYLARPMFVPTDPLYRVQWNFTQMDMERAWDINRGGTSNVIVAVVDSGIAFRSATIRYTATAWQRDDGVVFPALGTIDVPFAAAPDLRLSVDHNREWPGRSECRNLPVNRPRLNRKHGRRIYSKGRGSSAVGSFREAEQKGKRRGPSRRGARRSATRTRSRTAARARIAGTRA